jgi:hypothetical protein
MVSANMKDADRRENTSSPAQSSIDAQAPRDSNPNPWKLVTEQTAGFSSPDISSPTAFPALSQMPKSVSSKKTMNKEKQAWTTNEDLDDTTRTPLSKNLSTSATRELPPVASPVPVPAKLLAQLSSPTPSRPGTPASAGLSNSDNVRLPSVRTLNIKSTKSTPSSPATPAAAAAMHVIQQHTDSTNPIIANRPATPASMNEPSSDNVSTTTTAVSRPSSPLPGKPIVGSAPQKLSTSEKKRLAKKKADEERAKVEMKVTQAPQEVFQEPLVGRKKKVKAVALTPAASRAASRTASPAKGAENPLAIGAKMESPEKSERAKQNEKVSKAAKDHKESKASKLSKAETERSPLNETSASESPADPASTIPEPSPPAQEPTTSKSFSKMSKTFAELDPRSQFLASPTIQFPRYEFSAAEAKVFFDSPNITEEDRSRLKRGLPVHTFALGKDNGRASERIMHHPVWGQLRGLSPEQEQYYLEVEKRVTEDKNPYKFSARRVVTAPAPTADWSGVELSADPGMLPQKIAQRFFSSDVPEDHVLEKFSDMLFSKGSSPHTRKVFEDLTPALLQDLKKKQKKEMETWEKKFLDMAKRNRKIAGVDARFRAHLDDHRETRV